MYDESIERSRGRAGVAPVEFEVPRLEPLRANFRSERPVSVILTGTAGDGKTFLCRKVWEDLGGNVATWRGEDPVRSLELSSGRRLTIIKDLSELKEGTAEHLQRMAEAVCGETSSEVFLLAANDGQLVEAWGKVPATPSVEKVRRVIEDLLVGDGEQEQSYALRLYNLSRMPAAELLDPILGAALAHPGWGGCAGCRGQGEAPTDRCPIWENLARLKAGLFQERLRHLLALCDHNEEHLAIRQILMVISNALLGHSEARDGLLRCSEVPAIVESGRASLASPYSNVFGGNLTAARRESLRVFEVLGRLGVGEETTNRVDNLLIYGADDPPLRELFIRLIESDRTYGFTDRYRILQSQYLEGHEDSAQDFLASLREQRRRLFFTIPPELAEPLSLWELTVFQYAGEYLHNVLAALRAGQQPSTDIVRRLVKGLNRVFTGMLTETDRRVVLATSGSHSQARVSRIEEGIVEVEPRRGQRVVLELRSGRPQLAVYLDRDSPTVLHLRLVRYEFLSRVAEGALPSSFSRECYEDLLSFKSQLLREYHRVEAGYGHSGRPEEMTLKLLEVDLRGHLASNAVELRL
jgi:hypothetical protein